MSTSSGKLMIAPGAVVCHESQLVGEVRIGSRTVVHPKACILAEAGPIIIGEGNLIEEQVVIHNKVDNESEEKETAKRGVEGRVMVIGDNNVFETGCKSMAAHIGDNNVFECKSSLGKNVEISNGCVISAGCSIQASNAMLEERTVIYGKDNRRRRQLDKPPAQNLQIDFLAKVLPNYHHLKKANTSGGQK